MFTIRIQGIWRASFAKPGENIAFGSMALNSRHFSVITDLLLNFDPIVV
jgi:hypothetical protein